MDGIAQQYRPPQLRQGHTKTSDRLSPYVNPSIHPEQHRSISTRNLKRYIFRARYVVIVRTTVIITWEPIALMIALPPSVGPAGRQHRTGIYAALEVFGGAQVKLIIGVGSIAVVRCPAAVVCDLASNWAAEDLGRYRGRGYGRGGCEACGCADAGRGG